MARFLDRHLPKLVVSPSFAAVLLFVYGFIGWTTYLSLTNSKLLPSYEFAGFVQYAQLFNTPRWEVAYTNLFVFGISFVGISTAIGLLLAILLDQRIQHEGFIRTVYLYPMALSFIVTGTAWKWILNPGLGIEATLRHWGWESARFDWLVDPQMAIYTIVLAAVWQSSGFAMALFLAGLRSINPEIIKAAEVDGIPTYRIYLNIIVPSLSPVFLSVFIILTHLSIKSFDLVVALTSGGPGYATDMPATFMYTMAFLRGNLGQAAASATMMLATILAIIVPYLYSSLRRAYD